MAEDSAPTLEDDDEIEPEEVSKTDLEKLDLAGIFESKSLHVVDNYFPDAFITRSGDMLRIRIEEHIYTKYWEHKYHARYFAAGLIRAVKRLAAEGQPISGGEIENSDPPHFFISWDLNLPANTAGAVVRESIESIFDLVWERADRILDDSDSVLLLGKDTGDGLGRLKEIEDVLEDLGYLVYIIKEQPDRLGESIIQKVLRHALSSKFVIVENTEPSGHLYEVPHIGKDAEMVMCFLQQKGKGATWMFEDAYHKFSNWHKVEYDAGNIPPAVQEACGWAEAFVEEYKAAQAKALPWLKAP